MKKNCLQCNKEYNKYRKSSVVKLKNGYKTYYSENPAKFCSQKCYHLFMKGKPLVGERLIKQRKSAQIAIDLRKNNPEIREKWITKMKEVCVGSKSSCWIVDRSKIANQDERNCYEYKVWSQSVRVRDKYKCRIENQDCSGRLEVHHILSWKDHPELHYKINNGITLCHFHHPRVREDEKRLIPTYMELVSVSKV